MKINYLHIFSLTLLLSSSNILAQWSNDPNQNLQVSNFGYFVSACEDGMGGAFVGWTTANDPAPSSWLQWVDKYGYVRWSQPLHITGNGVAQTQLKLIKSEPGKVILTFLDCIEVGWDTASWGPIFHTYLRANKIDTTGYLHWGERGITVTEDTSFTDEIYGFAEDEDNGIYVTWSTVYPPPYIGFEDTTVIRVQKISKNGERLWGKTGKYVSTWHGYNSPDPYISRRNPDGIFLKYYKQDVGNTLSSINPDMSVRWSKVNQWYWNIIPDENGGGAWARKMVIPFTANYKIIANRIDSLGNLLWSDSALIVENDIGTYSYLGEIAFIEEDILSITWTKSFYPSNNSTIAKIQNIRNDGSFIFQNGSMNISSNPDSTITGTIEGDLYFWRDYKETPSSLICSKFNKDGQEIWQTTITYSEMDAGVIISDGYNGSIIVWSKYFSPNTGVFIQKVSKNGILGEVITDIQLDEINNDYNFILHQNYPNPFNSETIINFELNQSEEIELNIYNCLGENVRKLFVGAKEKGNHSIKWDGKDKNNFNLSSGIYFIELKTNFGHKQLIKGVLLK